MLFFGASSPIFIIGFFRLCSLILCFRFRFRFLCPVVLFHIFCDEPNDRVRTYSCFILTRFMLLSEDNHIHQQGKKQNTSCPISILVEITGLEPVTS